MIAPHHPTRDPFEHGQNFSLQNLNTPAYQVEFLLLPEHEHTHKSRSRIPSPFPRTFLQLFLRTYSHKCLNPIPKEKSIRGGKECRRPFWVLCRRINQKSTKSLFVPVFLEGTLIGDAWHTSIGTSRDSICREKNEGTEYVVVAFVVVASFPWNNECTERSQHIFWPKRPMFFVLFPFLRGFFSQRKREEPLI